MASHNTVRAAMRLWAIMVAAGTILGVSASASGQSRLERAEREFQRAEQALNEARREAGQTRGAEQKARVECEIACQGACEGREDCDDPFEVNVEAGDDEEQVIIRQPRGDGRIERRIEVQLADGECCPACGRPMNEGAPRRTQLYGRAVPGGSGGLAELHGLLGQNPHAQAFGLGGEGGYGGGARGAHKAIVVGPGGQRREFNIKLGEGGPDGPMEGEEGRAEVHRFHIQTQDGEGPIHNQLRLERGAPGVSGKVIIIGPDGRRQEFDLGGNPGGQNPPRRRAPRVQIENFRDGQAPAAHPQQGGQRRTIQLRKISHGAPI